MWDRACRAFLPQPFREHQCRCEIGRGDQHDELLSAVARDEVAGSLSGLLKNSADCREAAVPFRVSERVVVWLEQIDIGHDQGDRRPESARPLPLLLQRLVEAATIRQPGEGVDEGEASEVVVGQFQLLGFLGDETLHLLFLSPQVTGSQPQQNRRRPHAGEDR